MTVPSICLAAGEVSGDLHGAALARALRRRWPDARLWGLGGPRMAAEGVDLLADLERLAVMGFAEVVRHLPYFLGLLSRVGRAIDERRPDLVVPIDYPGFNLRLAAAAHRRGVPVLYYIAPQVWAWKRGRVRQLARHADRVAVILPFEANDLGAEGVAAEFVGHPLLHDRPALPDRAAFCAALGLDPARPLLALLPGSREQELARHLELFVAAGRRAASSVDAQLVIARAHGLHGSAFARSEVPTTDDAWGLLGHARAALVKSGTGTLQAAIAGVPMVVAYRTSALTFALARRVVRVPWVSLVNLVAGAPVVREFVQGEATEEAIGPALERALAEGPEREAMIAALAQVREALSAPGGGDPSERVAAIAAELLAAGADPEPGGATR
ncbi:MAG TPA: lipid-A-disaccharide synthase [Longimicrobiales bacterium]|nr:lipid-A-disaccharide synthase [Longimicrobiales bacterium]